MSLKINPIRFGTDGWRGVIGAEFTFERLLSLAPIAARVLENNYGAVASSREIIVGYDRRFMSEDFARATAQTVRDAGFDVVLATGYGPTPAFSWAAKARGALGALVITASHNPPQYSGLKIKGAFGGSVSPEFTQQVETLLAKEDEVTPSQEGTLSEFDPWASYCEGLRSRVDIKAIEEAVSGKQLRVFADVMHGAAASGLERLLGTEISELNSDRDPLFGGKPPEPLPRYIPDLFRTIRSAAREASSQLRVGFVFDGDCDRIAAVDGEGNFLSSQILIPILIDHLVTRRGESGEVVKTVSGSDIIGRLSEHLGLPWWETPIGYKYIADRMQQSQVLIGGEESGGIGYGSHIPERDALMSALYVLEAIVKSGRDLSALYQELQQKTGFYSAYDRLDLPLASQAAKESLQARLAKEPLKIIADREVVDCLSIDGYKFRLQNDSWLLIRFSGTEPVLRLYCEAPTDLEVRQILDWAQIWATENS